MTIKICQHNWEERPIKLMSGAFCHLTVLKAVIFRDGFFHKLTKISFFVQSSTNLEKFKVTPRPLSPTINPAPPCSALNHHALSATSLLNIFRDSDSIISLGSPFQCLTSFTQSTSAHGRCITCFALFTFSLLSLLLHKLPNFALSHNFSWFFLSFLLSPSHCVMGDGGEVTRSLWSPYLSPGVNSMKSQAQSCK